MSRENVEIVRQLTPAPGQGLAAAWDDAAQLLHPKLEMDTTRVPAPGLAGVYMGPDKVARWWVEWVEAWGTLGDFEEPELIDAGDHVVSWFARHELRGKGSGVEVQMPEYGWVTTVREGKVVRATLYMDKNEALAAAGLSE